MLISIFFFIIDNARTFSYQGPRAVDSAVQGAHTSPSTDYTSQSTGYTSQSTGYPPPFHTQYGTPQVRRYGITSQLKPTHSKYSYTVGKLTLIPPIVTRVSARTFITQTEPKFVRCRVNRGRRRGYTFFSKQGFMDSPHSAPYILYT